MINTGPVMVPPGGKLRIEIAGQPFENYTRQGLIDDVTEYRAANHLRIGDPEREVDKRLAGVSGYCSPIPIQQTKPVIPRPRLIDRLNSWLSTRYSLLGTIQYVNATEAQRRAAICLRCPANRNWRSSCTSCSSENKRAIERNIIVISQNRRTILHDRLQACSIAGHENKVAVWLESKFLLHRKTFMDQLPGFCWLKSLP